MKNAIQACLVRTYALVHSTGLLSTSVGEWVFRSAYMGYKRFIEAGDLEPLRSLRSLVVPGTSVIDVGANLGFFTLKFGRWVCEGGKVIAIEPEPVNFGSLRRGVIRAGLSHVVDFVQAAAAERSGEVGLIVDPRHHGNHRIGDGGVPVAAVTIDELLAARGWPPVSLMKIDVQGAESRVLAGADETLTVLRPALFVEVCDEALRMCQSTAERLVTHLYGRGYSAYRLTNESILGPMSVAQALGEHKKKSYVDLLFLHAPAAMRAERRRPSRATTPAAAWVDPPPTDDPRGFHFRPRSAVGGLGLVLALNGRFYARVFTARWRTCCRDVLHA